MRRLRREVAETGDTTSDLTGLDDVEVLRHVIREVGAQKAAPAS